MNNRGLDPGSFIIETIQYDKYKTAWGTNVNIASMKPMNATQLVLKSNPVSVTNYTDGNVHEMYTFNHEATEQTPALTDYRYIGNDPYNYVYFNCDDLNNQNSETCEVWRIIGVFDVERTDPNDNTQTITERRMKFVRGSVLPETMKWDNRESETTYSGNNNGINKWDGSLIEIFLNVGYYNDSYENLGLKDISHNMIENVIYYVGGTYIKTNSTGHYGNVEEIYQWKRGNNVFNYEDYCIVNPSDYICYNNNYCQDNPTSYACDEHKSTSWEGKLALLYPSDMYMTYSNGVDDVCYSDPDDCYNLEYHPWDSENPYVVRETPGYPKRSWLYNTNINSSDNYSNIWFLNPHLMQDVYVFASSYDGISSYFTGATSGVRPTLYLSSSVQIIDGDGSINNPYKLGL